ncbi:MAG: glycosyltransferase family 2 protein [Microbacterium sp.]
MRDELGVLPHAITHLFDQGADHVLIADNRSTDGTSEWLLDAAAHDPRIHVALDAQPAHWQSEKTTRLARAAWQAGADGIVPFDADEFWFAPDARVADWLRAQTVSLVHADFHHMVPVGTVSGPLAESDFWIDRNPSFPGKVAVRSYPLLWIGPGNHSAARVGGAAGGLSIAHAQYRDPAQVARKVRQGAASAQLTGEGRHAAPRAEPCKWTAPLSA